MTNKTRTWILAYGVAFLTLTGCTQEAQKDYGNAGSHAASAAKATGKAISADASAVGHSVKDAVVNAQDANSRVSGRVKQAILDTPTIITSDLSVGTSGRTVTLHGWVHSEDQNQTAQKVARKVAGPFYTVDDQLKVKKGG